MATSRGAVRLRGLGPDRTRAARRWRESADPSPHGAGCECVSARGGGAPRANLISSAMTDARATRDERLARVLAELDRLVDWEKRDRDASMRRGIEPARDLCARLEHPERRFRCVHVAGTKGKGTT